jgi:GNAT superfamily N-acetyltransferase
LPHRCYGWVAECDGEVVAISMAERRNGSIFALFVLPEFEGKGSGTRLLDAAVEWLRQNGIERIWLTTARGTRAARFYRLRGRVCNAELPNGELHSESTSRWRSNRTTRCFHELYYLT